MTEFLFSNLFAEERRSFIAMISSIVLVFVMFVSYSLENYLLALASIILFAFFHYLADQAKKKETEV